MAIKGTGTKADPWIIDDWDNFIQKINNSTNSSNKYIKLSDEVDEKDRVFDMNKVNPEESPALNFNHIEIDGNGWTIRNYYAKKGTPPIVISGSSITNLHFINCYSTVEQLFDIVNSNIKLCMFSGRFDGGIPFNTGSTAPTFFRCSFNFIINNYNSWSGSFWQIKFDTCNFYIDASQLSLGPGYLTNCLLNGKLNSINSQSGNWLNSIINVKANSADLSRGPITMTLINKDNIPSITGNGIQVTTADLQNPEKLQELGFPIGVESDVVDY